MKHADAEDEGQESRPGVTQWPVYYVARYCGCRFSSLKTPCRYLNGSNSL
jgi:hypothetical protein